MNQWVDGWMDRWAGTCVGGYWMDREMDGWADWQMTD